MASYDNRVLVEYSVGSLAMTHPRPSAHVQLPSGLTPDSIAFDSHGNLWIAAQDDMVYEYGPGVSGMSASAISSINMSTYISGGGVDLAFDAQGDLWVSAVGSSNGSGPEGMVYEFGASTLGTTSTPSLTLVASTNPNAGTWALAFFPIPADLGLR